MTTQGWPATWRPDVIVCLGQAREVNDGRIACPRQVTSTIAVGACGECRLLTWCEDDRVRMPECSTEPD